MISFEKIKYGASAELIAHKKNRIVSIILLGFAGLFYGFGTSMKYYGADPSGIAIFIYAVSLVCLFSACINVFKDMHDIPSADVQMSMPLNSMERYFSRLLTIFYIWLLPFLISVAFGFLLSVLISTTNDPGNSSGFQTENTDRNLTAELIGFNLRVLLYYAETVLFVISATVICQCCVGSKAESRYIPVLVIAVISFLPMAVYYSIADKFVSVEYGTLRLLSNMSLYSVFYEDESAAELIFLGVKSLIYLAVIGCGVLIYRKRDARSVGRPIVFAVFFEVVTGLSLLLFFNVAHFDGFSPTAMFFAWLGSIILRLIVSRKEFNFSKILLWTGLYILYYIAFLMFMFAAFKTGGFGALYKVPDISELRESEVSYVNVVIYDPGGYYYNSYQKYSMEKNVSPYLSKDMESLEKFMGLVSDAAKQQSRVKGMFSGKMFGSDSVRAYRCSVTLMSKSGENHRVYSVGFYIPKGKVYEFIEECDEFKAGKSYV